MRRFQLLSILLLVFLCSNVWAEEGPGKKEKTGTTDRKTSEISGAEKKTAPVKDKTVKPENISPEKEKKQKSEKIKAPAKKTAEKKKDVKAGKPGEKPAGSEVHGSILFIDEGEYKYLRIPGYKSEISVKKNDESSGKGEIVRIPDKIEIEDSKKEPGGLFGFNRKTSDMLVKIFLGVMVFSIFLLYRVRSRKKSSKVLRRYPNR